MARSRKVAWRPWALASRSVPRSLESFTRYVRRPTARMSAYSEKVISDAALADIYAFLRSLPAAKKPADIPLLDQLRKPGR